MAEPLGPVIIEGLALVSDGFVGGHVAAQSGIGLNTFGFIWGGADIYEECAACADDITTSWGDCDCD